MRYKSKDVAATAVTKVSARRWTVRASTAALLASFLVSFGVTASNAGTANSSLGYYSASGYNYSNQAIVVTSSGYAEARTKVSVTSGSCAPSGYIGLRARLFTSGGSLNRESQNRYTSSCTMGYDSPIGAGGLYGTWYSYGVSFAWNGSSYNAVYTYKSPNQSS